MSYKKKDKETFSSKIPSYLKHLFGDYDLNCITETQLIERILNIGDIHEIKWLLQNFSKRKIKEFVEAKGLRRLTAKSYNFWTKYFSKDNELGHITGKTKKTLGQDSWR